MYPSSPNACPQGKTSVILDNLSFPLRKVSSSTPYWDGIDIAPRLHGVRIDPEFSRLTKLAGETSAGYISQAARLLTGLAYQTYREPLQYGTTNRLLQTVIDMVTEKLESAAGHLEHDAEDLRNRIMSSARQLRVFAATGKWDAVELKPLDGIDCFFYCGPLNTWHPRNAPCPLSLIVSSRNLARQLTVDNISNKSVELRDLVETASQVSLIDRREYLSRLPEIHTLDLVCIGGEAAVGKKNFAHFAPEEMPHASVKGRGHTLLFSNVLLERVKSATIPIMNSVFDNFPAIDSSIIDSTDSALTIWFRGHDVTHFMVPQNAVPKSRFTNGLTSFAMGVLEEAIADAGGLVALSCAVGERSVDSRVAMCAAISELIRYAHHSPADCADSASAMILFGFLSTLLPTSLKGTAGAIVDFTSSELLDKFGHYFRALFNARYFGSEQAIATVSGWGQLGRRYVADMPKQIDGYAMDLHYVEG